MKKTYTKHIILFVTLPILIGGLIYIFTRPDRLLMFEWFNKIGIGESIVKLRQGNDFNKFLNNWIIYNSPALIWTFSLTVLLGVIWDYKINRESILILLIPLILGALSELFQKLGIINGTYDFVDMILYITGGLFGIFLIRLLNNKNKISMKKKITYFLSVLAIGLFVFLAYGSDDDGESSTVDLNASVSFTGTQFVIKNNDSFDYNNAKLELNGDYVLKGYNLKAGETYTVGMLQFADKKGNRFTALQKPQKFSIWCDLSSGKNGFYYAEWQ